MPRLQEQAPRDETMRRTFQIKKPAGGAFSVSVAFYPNRVTLERENLNGAADDEETSGDRTNLRAAVRFVEYVAEWDMTGPWSVDGEEVAGEDQMIPIDVPVIRSIAAWITTQITTGIMETVFPNLRKLQQLQMRS